MDFDFCGKGEIAALEFAVPALVVRLEFIVHVVSFLGFEAKGIRAFWLRGVKLQKSEGVTFLLAYVS